jgi:hypothetical protein
MGRSLWILDDISALREMSDSVLEEDVHLLAALPAVRWRLSGGRGASDPGENPPAGAIVQYYLKKKPKGDVTLEILDSQGALVRKLSSKPEDKDGDPFAGLFPELNLGPKPLTTQPGVNRIIWDLEYDGAKTIKKAWSWGSASSGPNVLPGTYTLKLTVDGKSFSTPLVVKQDPRVQTPQDQLKEQLDLALRLRDDVTHLAEIVGQIRAIRTQLSARNELLKDTPKAADLVKLGKEVIGKLDSIEGRLHNPKAEFAYDIMAQRGGTQLYSKMGYLYGTLIGSDHPPTQGVRDVYALESRDLQALAAEFNGIVSGEIGRLKEMSRELDLPYVIIPPASGSEKKTDSIQGRR